MQHKKIKPRLSDKLLNDITQKYLSNLKNFINLRAAQNTNNRHLI